MAAQIRKPTPFDHADPAPRPAILAAKLRKRV
jgi:hypothetical protein